MRPGVLANVGAAGGRRALVRQVVVGWPSDGRGRPLREGPDGQLGLFGRCRHNHRTAHDPLGGGRRGRCDSVEGSACYVYDFITARARRLKSSLIRANLFV